MTAISYKIKSAFHFQFKKDLDWCYYQSPEIIAAQNLGKFHNQLLMFQIYCFLNFIWTIPEIIAENLQISSVIPNVVLLHWSAKRYLDWTFYKYCIKLYIFTFHQQRKVPFKAIYFSCTKTAFNSFLLYCFWFINIHTVVCHLICFSVCFKFALLK